MNAPFKIQQQPAYSDVVARLLDRAPAHLIDGAWRMFEGQNEIEVFDPSTARAIARQGDAPLDAVDAAVAAARRAFDDGRWTGLAPSARERLLHRLADLIEAHLDELGELEAIDNGKPAAVAKGFDIPRAAASLRYLAGWATKLEGSTCEPAMSPTGSFHAYVRREPIGVAALIVPWNFPFLMAVLKIAPALAAGCTMVLKPAEQTPLSALRLGDLILEAGFPAGVVNIVTGRGESVGDRLVRHGDVDKVAFTGSTEVGKLINRAATDTLKRVTLELGGKSPVIVMPDVDPRAVAPNLSQAIFFNAGQVCVAGSRLYAHKSVFDAVLENVAEQAGAWAIGPALAPETTLGPLISQEQRDRVASYIEAGRRDGAALIAGGEAVGDAGYFFRPTILADVRPEMSVVREEIFGPVLVAQRFEELDEVARVANATPYGLAAGIWTRDMTAMHTLAAKLRAGVVWGNCHGVIDPAFPFGGFKQSGFGREQSLAGVEAYTELKTVVIALNG